MSSIFDYNDGDFLFQTSDNTAMDMDGNMMIRMSDGMCMDMTTGELHITSSWDEETHKTSLWDEED